MAFKMKGFKAHDMFNPKTGEKFRAKKLADHKRMDEMAYTHDSPKKRTLTASCKAAAKRKFDVYPSAYANMWASKQQGKGKC